MSHGFFVERMEAHYQKTVWTLAPRIIHLGSYEAHYPFGATTGQGTTTCNHHSNRTCRTVARHKTVQSLWLLSYLLYRWRGWNRKRQQPSVSMNRVIDGCNFLFRDSLNASLVLQVPSLQVPAQRMDGGGALIPQTQSSQRRSKVIKNFCIYVRLCP